MGDARYFYHGFKLPSLQEIRKGLNAAFNSEIEFCNNLLHFESRKISLQVTIQLCVIVKIKILSV